MQPNQDCSDTRCRELQKLKKENPSLLRIKPKVVKEESVVKHEDNEWGIQIESE